MSHTQRIEEIRQRVQNLDGGDWYRTKQASGFAIRSQSRALVAFCRENGLDDKEQEKNSDFIINAKSDIEYLLRVIDELSNQ